MSSTQKLSSRESKSVIELIMKWLSDQLTTDTFMWLSRKAMRLKQQPDNKQFNMVFKTIPKNLSTSKLFITQEDMNHAGLYRKHWTPVDWRIDEAARIVILLTIVDNTDYFMSCMDKIFSQSKDSELISFYKGLPLFPQAQKWLPYAVHALKENRKPVFEALALNNPYPFENFDDKKWGEMICHAQELDVDLDMIFGLDTELKTSKK
jgi:hypothetical protein